MSDFDVELRHDGARDEPPADEHDPAGDMHEPYPQDRPDDHYDHLPEP